MAVLEPQKRKRPGEVEIICLSWPFGYKTVGQKRNEMLGMATGDYVCFVDDDDLVPEYYVDELLNAIHEHAPDVVGWWMRRYEDGILKGYHVHSVAVKHYETHSLGGYTEWLRPPTHLNAVKTELARDTAFPNRDKGEDVDYAMRLRSKLKKECFIDKCMYEYYFVYPEHRIEILELYQREQKNRMF